MKKETIEKILKQIYYQMENPELPQWAWNALNQRMQRLARMWNNENHGY